MTCYGDHFHESTEQQHARHDVAAEVFCDLVKTLLFLAATHKEKRIRHTALQCISSFALLKADPAGDHALCGPKVKRAIEGAMLMMATPSPSEMSN